MLLAYGDEHVYEVEPGYGGPPKLMARWTCSDTASNWLGVSVAAPTCHMFIR